jgi:signal transduction histidine kinase
MVRAFNATPWFVPRAGALFFAAALLAVILDAFLFSYVIDSVEENARVIQAARGEIDQLVAAKDLLQDAETGQRGYLLTGREQYLQPYLNATRNIDAVIAKIVGVPNLPPDQLAKVQEIERLTRLKLDELAQTLDLFRRGASGDALVVVQSDVGKVAMDRVRALIEERQAAVQSWQDEARAKRARLFRWGLIVNIVMAAIAASLLLGLGIAIVRHLTRRHEFERKLQLSNVELERAVAERTEDLAKLSHHLLSVREEEKSALAREMHDGLGSSLTAVRMDLLSARSAHSSPEGVRSAVDSALAALDTAIEQQRSALQGLHPRLLDTMGLRFALENYVAEFSKRTGILSELVFSEGAERLDDARSIALFRIVQEALNNVTKHSGAKNVSIRLDQAGDQITLKVIDDGTGLDNSQDAPRASLGLISMRERARQFRGDCSISPAPGGHGAQLTATIRLDVAPRPVNGGGVVADDRRQY